MRAAGAVALGGAWGWLSWWGDHQHSQYLAVMTNIGGPWLLFAFLMGMWADNVYEGGVLGALTLAAAVCAYYGIYQATRTNDPTMETRFFLNHGIAWLPIAAIGGAMFGVAGSLWRFGNGWLRPAAVALLGGALIAESILNIDDVGTYNSVNAGHMAALACEAVVGILLPFFLLKRGREMAISVGLTIAVALVGIGVEQAVFDYIQNTYWA